MQQTAPLGSVLRHVRSLAAARGTGELTDRQLLQRFAARGEEEAFAALVQRYGRLVWRVCRHVLRHDQDAEDAFQATFLVLARSGASIRKHEALASWLHGTAHRIALRARRDAAVRRRHESRGKSMPAEKPIPEAALREALALLDEEVQGLPPRQRAAFVLCALEGKSLAEAAQQLGWKQGTVSGTLARARRELGRRLGRRGVTLSAALSAVVLGRQAASAALPAGLARATTEAALLYAAGKSAAALASVPAAALAEGVSKTMFLTKLKIATVLALAVGVAGLLTRQALAARQVVTPQPPAGDAKPAAPKGNDHAPAAGPRDNAGQAVTGRVLDADGKPCAGARLFVWTSTVKNQADMPVRATTDSDGRFHLAVARADRERGAKVVARAPGHGPDWFEVAGPDKGGEVTLRLARDDVPVNGRVIDLEGRPVPGASVSVIRLEDRASKPWVKAVKGAPSAQHDRDLAATALDGPATVTSGKDGRFRLAGFGRDRVVFLRLHGEGIEHCVFWVVTHEGPLPGMRTGPYGTYSATFTHHALPGKPIVGTVRDKATGRPLAGISVASSRYNWHFAKTDDKGHYRIVGAAKRDLYSVSAGGAPYLNSTKLDVADTPGLEPVTVDFDLERGVAITGRLTDQATGKPVRGYLSYIPLADNPNVKNYTELGKPQALASDEGQARADGSFIVTAIPGPGILLARADDEDHFLAAEAEGIKLAVPIILDGYHALIPVNPAEADPKSTRRDVALVPGRSLNGTVTDTDGRPLAGAHAAGLGATPRLFDQSAGRLATPSFSVGGLGPKKARRVAFIHPERKLARLLAVRPDEPGPLTVRLEAMGALAGRVVDAGGKPLAGLKVSARISFASSSYKDLPADLRVNSQSWSRVIDREATTDEDGKFRVEGLVPGLMYQLTVTREAEVLAGCTRDDLAVESGKARDLGELKDQPAKEAKERP
jgi:RNA polymerase sigma factor (sigma-70 family)